MATVILLLFYKSYLCYHYFGGITPLYAKSIATVHLLTLTISGEWFHCSGGIYLQLYAISYATVQPFIF